MKATAIRNLTYEVRIDREENEEWAPYNDRGVDYQIDSVVVDVSVSENGVFSVHDYAHVVKGYRLRKDGTPGRSMGGGFNGAIYWALNPETQEQERKFKDEALRVARAAHLSR
jgi:hypothetical protein